MKTIFKHMTMAAGVAVAGTLMADPFGALPDATHAWGVHDDNRPPVKKIVADAGKAPSDAKVLFDGTAESIAANWCDANGKPTKWTLDPKGELISVAGAGYIFTKDRFSDFQLHVEWAAPTGYDASVTGQARGNSGVFLMGNYEIQVLDSYETDADAPGGNKNPNYSDGQAGAAYGQNPPLVNPCRAPGVFNSYDIIFHAPIETAEGVIKRPATVTVLFNGVVVQDHWLFDGPTGWRERATYARTTSDTGLKRTEKMPIAFQDHGNPVHFRNVWVRELSRPEDNVTHGDWYAKPDKVLELRRETAAKLDAEFDAKWGSEKHLARKLMEAWRIATYAVSPHCMARIAALEEEYGEFLAKVKKPNDVGQAGVSFWDMKKFYERLAAAKLVRPDNAILTMLAMTGERNLSGTWRLEGTDEKGAAISCPIAVPGDVHSALYRAKLIPDPFWGDNEKQTQWVGRHDWTVVRTFEVDAATLAKKAVVLRLEDVDLFATVYVNGHEIGRTDDRYCRWEFDVKPYLKKGANELKGVFGSSENAVPALAKGYEPRTFNMACAETRWLKSLSLLRKPACHGGWDWGLAQMITGFCGDVKLLAYDDFKVDYVYSDQKFNDDFTHCDLAVFVDVTDANGKSSTVTNRFSIDNPPLWWPNGAGEQRFYTCTLDVRGRKIEKRVGLRKIEVLNTPDVDANGKPGARMAFRVNGREIFMKGADWIPCSAFDAEQTPARYRDLVQSAAAANMNMLRVWGGGQFEKDAFYDACDEAGILLWHDFMFSCALYPGDDVFLGKLRGELRHQLRRLRDHASIALWCGDNECVGALGWWRADDKEKALRRAEFEKRCAVMNECIAKYDPTRQFWPSSPCAGPGNYADNWHDDSFGDMHLWTVWHENKPFSDYYRYHPRFCSEFGFQSFSSPEVAETFATKEDIAAHAPAFEWHQKNLGGNDRIRKTMARYFRSPKDAVSELLLSQFQQGLAIRTAVENWRTQRPRCMGTLYWQLNDNWPVASWSSVEYGGKWKPLHHLARRFFAPVWVVANPEGRVFAINDTAETVKGELTLEYWTYGGKVLSSETRSVTLAPDAATVVGACAAPKDVPAFLVMTLKTPKGTVRNDWHFAAYKDVPVAQAKIEAKVEGLKVTLSADKPAFFVWANVRGVRGEFDDNCLTLLPGRPVTLTFEPKAPLDDAAAFAKAFSVTHLADIVK